MVKYSEKLFMSMYQGLEKSGHRPDTCMCGSDLVAQEVLKTVAKHNLEIHVIADDELSAKSFWLTTQEALSKLPLGGRN